VDHEIRSFRLKNSVLKQAFIQVWLESTTEATLHDKIAEQPEL